MLCLLPALWQWSILRAWLFTFGLSACWVVPGCITTQLGLLQKQSLPSLVWYCSYSDEDIGCSRFSRAVYSHLVYVSFSASASFCGNDLMLSTRSKSENANIYSRCCLSCSQPFSHLQSNQRQPWGSFRKCAVGFSTHSNARLLTWRWGVTNSLWVEVDHSYRSWVSAPSSGHLLRLLTVLRFYLHEVSWLDLTD